MRLRLKQKNFSLFCEGATMKIMILLDQLGLRLTFDSFLAQIWTLVKCFVHGYLLDTKM